MSYDTELAAISRRPQTVVLINLDYCDNTFGVAPCTATGTGDAKCYNTKKTCKDTPNYVTTTGKDYKFCTKEGLLPFSGEEWRPYLSKISYLPTEIDPKKAITVNARVTLEFYDEPDNDIGIDPYVSGRSTYPDAQGTFWKKLSSRNPYYIGRMVTIKEGFHGLSEANYKSKRFIIDQIKNLKDGKVQIICKDLLKWADRVQIPSATDGKVSDDPLTSGAATINVSFDGSGTISQYSSSGYIRLEDSIIKYTGTTASSFTGCTWGQFETVQEDIDQDTVIQQCYVKLSTNVVDIILDIDQNHVNIAASDINTTMFSDEKTDWLQTFNFDVVYSEPTIASVIIANLLQQSIANQWWSDEDEELQFKVVAPRMGTYASLTDDNNIKKIDVQNNEKSRVSRVEIYYNYKGIGDLDKRDSFKSLYVDWDVDAESSSEFNEKAIMKIYANGITSSNIVKIIAKRYLQRFRNSAKKATLTLELKDSGIKTADFVNVTTDQILDHDGSELLRIFQVTKKKQRSKSDFDYTLLETAWDKNYGFIAPAGQPNWDSATSSQKKYAYIGDAANNQLGAANDDGFYIF